MHLINFGGDDNALLQTGKELVAMAERAGVKRVTVLLGPEKGPLEQAVEESSMAWTFLQPVEFMSGGLDFAEAIRSGGVVKVPFASRKTAMVHDARHRFGRGGGADAGRSCGPGVHHYRGRGADAARHAPKYRRGARS